MLKIAPYQNNVKFGYFDATSETDRAKYVDYAKYLKGRVGLKEEFLIAAMNEKEKCKDDTMFGENRFTPEFINKMYNAIQEKLNNVINGEQIELAYTKARIGYETLVKETEAKLKDLKDNEDAHIAKRQQSEMWQYFSNLQAANEGQTGRIILWRVWERMFPSQESKS